MKRSIDGGQAAPARLPTIPALAGLGGDRSVLLAALMFVEGAASRWTEADLIAWFRDHLVAPGLLAPPAAVTEMLVGTILLSKTPSQPPPMSSKRPTSPQLPLASASQQSAAMSSRPPPPSGSQAPTSRRTSRPPSGNLPRFAHLDELPKLLGIARSRVVVTMRAFRGPPSDDRFLQAAIFGERVERTRAQGGRQNAWVPRLDPSMELSTMVLTLFAADMLMNRESYDVSLSVCDVCGRIGFVPDGAARNRCAEHPSSSDGRSGFHKRNVT